MKLKDEIKMFVSLFVKPFNVDVFINQFIYEYKHAKTFTIA